MENRPCKNKGDGGDYRDLACTKRRHIESVSFITSRDFVVAVAIAADTSWSRSVGVALND